MSFVLDQICKLATQHGDAIHAWLHSEFKKTPAHFYTSVDLRHSGHKLAPVDTNLFPAGFNNLSPRAATLAAERAATFFRTHYPAAKKLLLIPENHSRNLFYFDNILALLGILEKAGMEVRIGSLILQEAQDFTSASGKTAHYAPLKRNGNQLITADGFTPDLVILNNDLTSGFPELFEGAAQPIIPSPMMGWWRRRKSAHFGAYSAVVKQFSEQFPIDPWLLDAAFHPCGMIRFKDRKGIECVALGVEKVLHKVRQKYEEYGVKDEPYVFIKADSGTYGMGIMTARSGEEVMAMNKKTRNKMSVVKEGAENSEVIIQEGIPTIDQVGGQPAEPLIYALDGMPVGCMYRSNGNRDPFTNLNAEGMSFHGVCESDEQCGKSHLTLPGWDFTPFSLTARLAMLASAREDYES